MKKWIKVVGIVSVIAIVGVLILGAVAFAQGPADGPFNPGGKMGRPPFGMRGPGAFGPMRHPGGPQMNGGNELAEVLGMSAEEFQTALQEGQRQALVNIVESQGMTLEEVAQALYDKAVERLESAVADGKLTQEQADHILEKVTERRDSCINGGDCMPPRPPRPPMTR